MRTLNNRLKKKTKTKTKTKNYFKARFMECTHSKVYSDQIEANCKPTVDIDIFSILTLFTQHFS